MRSASMTIGRAPRRATFALLATVLAALSLPVGCGGDDRPDAYGNFEATEVTVSAEASGRLLDFVAREGLTLDAGAVVGRIETTAEQLRLDETIARRRSAEARIAEAEAQVDVLLAQLETAREELARERRLAAAEASTERQVNLRQGEVRRLEEQVEAARRTATSAARELGAIEAQIAQVEDRIADAEIVNPITGTVLAVYAEPGELVTTGAPLYDLADLDPITLRAYLAETQLGEVRLGQEVVVRWDVGEDRFGERPGRVTWIADEAEFTPTRIQTREERVDLVYAVEVAVANPEGRLKVGMPAEIEIPGDREASE